MQWDHPPAPLSPACFLQPPSLCGVTEAAGRVQRPELILGAGWLKDQHIVKHQQALLNTNLPIVEETFGFLGHPTRRSQNLLQANKFVYVC